MKKILLTAIAALLLTSTMVIAQPPDPLEPPPPPATPEERARMHERFCTMQIWKLTEALDMTEEQTDKFLPMFRKFQKEIDAIRVANGELFKKMEGYITAEDKSEIEGIISQIEKNEQAILMTRTNFRKKAAKVLDEIQIGKLIMFQREFPRHFRNAIWDVQQRHGGPPEPPSGKRGKRLNKPGAPMGMKMQKSGMGQFCQCWCLYN